MQPNVCAQLRTVNFQVCVNSFSPERACLLTSFRGDLFHRLCRLHSIFTNTILQLIKSKCWIRLFYRYPVSFHIRCFFNNLNMRFVSGMSSLSSIWIDLQCTRSVRDFLEVVQGGRISCIFCSASWEFYFCLYRGVLVD